jgi:hypothetical protein
MIRRLWDGETVDGQGRFEGAAQAAARYGDGIWTLGDPELATDVLETSTSRGSRSCRNSASRRSR